MQQKLKAKKAPFPIQLEEVPKSPFVLFV